MKFWDQFKKWDEAEAAWDQAEVTAVQKSPLKVLKTLPVMQGITPETAKHLKWKSFKWMLLQDKGLKVFKNVIKRPFFHLKNYINSIIKKQSFKRDGDFFFYGIADNAAFEKLLIKPNTLLVLGFSYCHKPFECPSGRFTDACIHDIHNPVCQQCFIGKCVHAAPKGRVVPVSIPTVHYIGDRILTLINQHPDKEIIFLITACEMTLTMFADWGNMAGIKGVGVRLDGRICNTMKAFELSEEGIKPGLTVVNQNAKQKMLDWIRVRRKSEDASSL